MTQDQEKQHPGIKRRVMGIAAVVFTVAVIVLAVAFALRSIKGSENRTDNSTVTAACRTSLKEVHRQSLEIEADLGDTQAVKHIGVWRSW